MRYRLPTLMTVLASLGSVMLLLECGIAMIPDDFSPFGIGGWLAQLFVVIYGFPITLILTLASFAGVALTQDNRRPT